MRLHYPKFDAYLGTLWKDMFKTRKVHFVFLLFGVIKTNNKIKGLELFINYESLVGNQIKAISH